MNHFLFCNLAGIAKFMKAQTGPASKELNKLVDFEEFIKVQETAVIGFFQKDSALKSVFQKYADKFREKLRFGHSSAADILKKNAQTLDNNLNYFNTFFIQCIYLQRCNCFIPCTTVQ